MLPTFISGILNIHFRIIQMRNIAIVPGLLALLLTGVLFYVVYHKPQPAAVAAAGPGSNQPVSDNLRMAYFNLDSLEAHYQYFKDVLDQVKGKENEMNAELSGMEKNYQKKITEWQKKAPTMSPAEGQEAQQEYAQMQQNYQMRKQTLQESLLKHNEDLKADIRKKIEDYLAGRMVPEDIIVFEKEMARDPELQKAVESQKKIMKAMEKTYVKRSILKAGQKIRMYSVLKKGGIIVSVLVILAAAFIGYTEIKKQIDKKGPDIQENIRPTQRRMLR